MVCGVHVSVPYFSKTLVHSDHPNGAWGRFRICDDGVQTSNCFNKAEVLKELCPKIHQNSNSKLVLIGWNIENAAQSVKEFIKNTKYEKKAGMDKFLRRRFIFVVWEVIYFTTEKKNQRWDTENTQKQCVEEAQKETIRLIDAGPRQGIKV